jgi:hypothetical protein
MEAIADSSGAADDPQLLLLHEEQQQQKNDDDTSSSDDGGGGKSLPAPLYTQNQRVYAKDETTGLLYPAMIRKAMWGPKSESSLPIPALLELATSNNNDTSGDSGEGNDTGTNQTVEEQDEEEDDEDDHRTNPKLNCHHYYVHYMGWNVKWDRWVNEVYLYDHSDSTKLLAEKIQKEYDKVKPKKKGQKMTVSQVSRWMKKMVEVELEHRRLEREGKLLLSGSGDTTSSEGNVEDASKNDSDGVATSNEVTDKDESKSTQPVAAADEKAKPKDVTKPIVKEETLQKQAQLRTRGLQLKRKRIHADRLHLPFTLKKILVEEWEVISQCGMLYVLPSKVSVRDVLNSYLESKLLPLRESSGQKGEGDNMEVDEDNDEKQSSLVDREKEWNNMVKGIALLFDQALPIHLLFEDERTQYASLRRQILAQRRRAAYNDQPDAMKLGGVNNNSGTNAGANNNYGQPVTESSHAKSSTNTGSETLENKPLPDRMSEIYGCEHLLRLFIRLPAVVAATPSISEPDARRIFSKLGDLVRYIQKHQSELFKSTFRKPLQNELRKVGKEKVAED